MNTIKIDAEKIKERIKQLNEGKASFLQFPYGFSVNDYKNFLISILQFMEEFSE